MEVETYTVDKGIPVPSSVGILEPIREMEVGDSVMFPKEKRPTIQAYVSRLKARSNKVYTVRVVDSHNCRVWRTE